MPAHFTHALFAEEALALSLGEAGKNLLAAHGNLFRFGAQGPDFFYHNQRTMPTGLRYGVAIHRSGYGALVESMVREALRLRVAPDSELAAFILGFATHAPLDRRTHPFIGYFSGWVDPQKPETKRLFQCHPFLERLIDVAVLRERFGREPAQFDFLPAVRCGKALPYAVVKATLKGLHATYPAMRYKSRDRKRIENAYRDAMFFYTLTNHMNPLLPRLVYRKDSKDGFRQRRLALIHPREVPEGLDVLNAKQAPWCHPCDSALVSRASFLELYEEALLDAKAMLADIFSVLSGRGPVEGLGERIGNQSLDTGREPCAPVHSQPLPLPEILDEMYRRLGDAHR
jgi:thiol-disulfide isomerase/thioredoxin